MIYAVAVFAPLLGSVIAGLFGRVMGDRAAQVVTIALMIAAAICGSLSLYTLLSSPPGSLPDVVRVSDWIQAGDLHVNWALRYDTLSAVMVAMVTFVATLIHVYSTGYMAHDSLPNYRFFSYLSLFTFAMLMLVTADNLLQLFFGWEGVGLASYLLIGYWYYKDSANAAAMKAFIVNRVGDLFFAVGIALVFWTFGSIEFSAIFGTVSQHVNDHYHLFGTDPRTFEVIGFLLFIGAMGKSAQIGLHVWLPDAMEGPTPVSALIHAATMVTAGVFLMARMSPLLEFAPDAKTFIVLIGGTTALFAATIGCAQNDIKKVIAYSTCSQLGYMFVAAGVGAYEVSVFHLITHAFFKALLFLGAGSVIHAMSDEQDMRKMGGIWKMIPFTYAVMWIGNLALAGIPPFAGFYSKDAILEAAWAQGGVGFYGYVCGTLAAFLTAFYSWRLTIMTFHGKPRADHHTMEHVHESPLVMLAPLALLSIGAIAGGMLLEHWFIGEGMSAFWRGAVFNGPDNHVMHEMHHIPFLASILPTILGVLGIVLAYWMYMFNPGAPARLAAMFPAIYRLFANKWYFDEIYAALIVRPYQCFARLLWTVGDATIIDGIPNGLASLTVDGSSRVVKLQTGSIAVYAFAMLIGLVALVSIFLIFR
ncbi:NADH-quinone oxidoreductase chain L [Granulibacter bethesdensis]|uniref:NADH-quinone oxidoreductase chain L n=1 Tax=Granulibacter bethesdensis TaxID=364410 RepID=A0AAC9P8I9_9PROT|nr:NADH-quinone oxidoreductase subunit L [Granulibacter bethesdensis]APH54591.1 NADH-quinone oxidoreductase chain L [Granulibacter bethesdensis]APH62177.1 NADH-quinone oxidoreductase chain L [Granulibacter bethesdensis]